MWAEGSTPPLAHNPELLPTQEQGKLIVMDLRLREVTWIRLLSLLAWTILMMTKRGITQLIEIIKSRVFDVSEQTPRKKEQKQRVEERTLLPPLSDELVLSRIWPLLHKRVNVSLLWRLRRVNRAWKEKVGTTVEWAALEMVRVDSPGFLQFLAARREPRPSLCERVESEMIAFTVLLAEHLVSFSDHSESIQSGTGSLGPDEDGRRRHPTGIVSRELESEGASSQCYPCGATRFAYMRGFLT